MEETVLSSALLQLGLTLVSLCLEMDDLVSGAVELSPTPVQLGFVVVTLGRDLLQLLLALLKFSGELLLAGAHGGGDLLRDFQELSTRLLQGLQLGRDGNRESRVNLDLPFCLPDMEMIQL